ncbi:MAG: patatin-like phospholipase family protein [bacterium]
MKSAFIIALILCALAVTSDAYGQRIVVGGLNGNAAEDTTESYTISMALSGGGARGLAVIGILKAFEEKGIEVTALTGTSIGGIIGGLYASGYSPDELISITRDIAFNRLLTNSPARKTMFLTQREERERSLLSIRFDGLVPVIPRGLTAGQKLNSLLTALTTKANYHCGSDFSRLPIPFRTISTDIVTGREVVHAGGSLAEAMRATLAFPLAFTGLDKDDQLLMDGGIVTPVPVDLVRTMSDSTALVVAVNTSSPLLAKRDLVTPVDIANQVTTIMSRDRLAAQMRAADYAIEPPLDGFSSVDFKHRDTLVEIGYRTGLTAADSITDILDQRRHETEISIVQVNVKCHSSALADTISDRLGNITVTRAQLVSLLQSLLDEFDLFRLMADLLPCRDSALPTETICLEIVADQCIRMRDADFRFIGNTVFDSTQPATHFNGGDTLLTPQRLRQGLDAIIDMYHNEGYDLAVIKDVTIDMKALEVSVVIDEAIIRRIDVDRNERTRDWFVRSLFPLKVGQPYSTSQASKGIANIFGSDLFDQVMVDLVSYRDGAVVKISVEEKQQPVVRLGWHWDDEYQSEEFIEVLDDNIIGIGLQLLLHSRYARDSQNHFASLKTDRIFSTYMTARLGAYHRRLKRHLFDTDGARADERTELRTGAEFGLGQQIARLGTVSAGLVFEQLDYRHPLDYHREVLDLRMLKFTSEVETFDRVPFPRTGKKHLFELQFAGKYLGGETEFTRFFTSIEAYFALKPYLNYHPKLAVGLSRSNLPVSERFYLGGMHSFMGFRTHQLSGDKLFMLSNELRLKLPLWLYLTARHDMGEVYTAADEIKLRNLRHGVGLFLSLDSPIGPVEFGYGVADTDEERFYLNVGYTF